MKREFTIFAALVLTAACATGAAQDYYTLPEIRKQAEAGWHETYTDKYGRTRRVDVDIEVFGEETAPVIEACWAEPEEFRFAENEPRAEIKEARIKRNGVSTYLYPEVRGMKVDPDQQYAADYGNDMTLCEVYGFLKELLQAQGVKQAYCWEEPSSFGVLYSVHKDTGELLVPALYSVDLWQMEFGLPILTSVADSYRMWIDGPVISPGLGFDMSNRYSYSGGGNALDVADVLAEDIPLCSVEKVIEGARKMIEDGYIQQVHALRFGYVIYGDPDEEWGKQKAGFDMDTWYLVPSWVVDCYMLEDPKVDELPEYPTIKTMTINAQTGEMADYFDTSLYGRGDPRYKGFLSWEDVR